MPQRRREQSRGDDEEAQGRIVTGTDPLRFYCPHSGCNRSFAELWRLKVHYRAAPDVRGSGRERGHGMELKWCPKCGKDLKPGKHHVGCSAGKSAPRQAAKRQRQLSSATESDYVTPSSDVEPSTEPESDSWDATVRRQASRVQRVSSGDAESAMRAAAGGGGGASTSGGGGGRTAGGDVCRVERMQQALATGDHHDLVFTDRTMAHFGLVLRSGPDAAGAPEFAPTSSDHHQQLEQEQHQRPGSGMEMAPLGGGSPSASLAALLQGSDSLDLGRGEGLGAGDMLRVPSPPPLPPDWDLDAAHGSAMLFDFDQFDVNRRADPPDAAAPIMTATSAMAPSEMSNPSDDYIWQILFAGEHDVVPKRVTAHLHHPTTASAFAAQQQRVEQAGQDGATHGVELASIFDDANPILDAIPWPDQSEARPSGNGQMQPPPPRAPAASDVPPPPPSALDALAAQENGPGSQPQVVTVTYLVQPGPAGKQQYAVQSINGEPVVGTDAATTSAAADAPQSLPNGAAGGTLHGAE